MTKQQKQPTYTVSIWDHNSGWWEPRFRRVAGARAAMLRVRQLENEGWDRGISILVERNYTAADRKAINNKIAAAFRKAIDEEG